MEIGGRSEYVFPMLNNFLSFFLFLFLVIPTIGNTEDFTGNVKTPEDYERYVKIQDIDRKNDEAKVYVDVLSPKKDENKVYYWKVVDFQKPKLLDGDKVSSIRIFSLSDCL